MAAFPTRTAGARRFPGVILIAPMAALIVGVSLIRWVGSGAELLALLATLGAPLGAACLGWVAGWRRWWICPPLAASVYLVAWFASGLVADAAGVLLIGGACLTVAWWAAAGVPARWLVGGLVALAVLDCVLVLGLDAVRPATVALHAVQPLSPLDLGQPLPRLQDATFGSALMGWLDLFAPALLAVLMAASLRNRLTAAVVTVAAGWAWGSLLLVRAEIPATVPVLAGCVVWCLHRSMRTRNPALESAA